jgi:hypothetical protein
MAALIARTVTGAARHEGHYAEAFAWAVGLAVPRHDALAAISLHAKAAALPVHLLEEGTRRAASSGVEMGGPGILGRAYESLG